jgi:hypothetical protein
MNEVQGQLSSPLYDLLTFIGFLLQNMQRICPLREVCVTEKAQGAGALGFPMLPEGRQGVSLKEILHLLIFAHECIWERKKESARIQILPGHFRNRKYPWVT